MIKLLTLATMAVFLMVLANGDRSSPTPEPARPTETPVAQTPTPNGSTHSNGGGRSGPGVGAWSHQQEPYMVPSSTRVLEEGMVVALELHIGYWHLQDMVLVTGGAPRLL